MREPKMYKPLRSFMGGGLIVAAILFFGLTLPLILAGQPVETKKLLGLGGFWFITFIVTFVPMTSRLEIGDTHVATYILGFRTSKIMSSNVQNLEYGNLFRFGGLGMGKGINIWANNKFYSIGEAAYGKEAVGHAREVLVKDLPHLK